LNILVKLRIETGMQERCTSEKKSGIIPGNFTLQMKNDDTEGELKLKGILIATCC